MKPLFTNVLIRPNKEEEKSAGGLYLPENKKERPQKGEVIAIGGGTKDDPIIVKVGDQVLYRKWSGDEVKDKEEELIMVEQKDILAIL